MKDFMNRPGFVRSLEFWTAISIFIVIVFFRISGMIGGDLYGMRDASGKIPSYFYRLYFFPQILQYVSFFLAFMLLNFVIVPRIIAGRSLVLNLITAILTIGALGFVLAVLDTYLRNPVLRDFSSIAEAHASIFRDRALYMIQVTIVYGIYAAAIHGCMYLIANLDRLRERFAVLSLAPILATAAWLISLFFLMVLTTERELITFWAIFPASSILVYTLSSTFLIPPALRKRKPFRSYLFKSCLWLLAAFLPIGAVASIISTRPDIGLPMAMMNSIFQFLIATPMTWVFYMRRQKTLEELQALQGKLDQSRANLDFLRSQINPHFLFNALNTIYGTALEEKAERTGEGVHRLGEMMRFMLQENTQEQIPLAREIEYLNHYIALQRLRTDLHPGIEIRTEIPQAATLACIAPMLLIPFVENAFKHGISFRRPSYIRIAMELHGTTLNFDVHNSRHQKHENDPERHSGGIGLKNVRQRLELLYPGAHELILRETGREHFVHLTLQLHAVPLAVQPAASAIENAPLNA